MSSREDYERDQNSDREVDAEDTPSAKINPNFAVTKTEYDISQHINDYESWEQLYKTQSEARAELFRLTELINQHDRRAAYYKIRMDREYNRLYLDDSNSSNATLRKISAEIKIEKIADKFYYHDQLKKEYERMAYTLRMEMQMIQSLGNNLRQQARMA